MKHELQFGPILKILIQRAKKGLPTPALDNWPQIWPSLQPAWDAFRMLSRNEGEIDVASIWAWAQIQGYEDMEDVSELVQLVKALDHALAAHRAELIEKAQRTQTLNAGKRKTG